MYLEPEMVDDELIDYIAGSKKVVKYMDIPFQHVDSRILKLMGRHTDEEYTKELIKKVKNKGIAIRSSFIVGFPTEGEEEFNKLCDFIKEYKIDYAGFFGYSLEEGTPAEKLPDRVSEKTIRKRVARLASVQEEVIKAQSRNYIGKTLDVIYENIDYDKQLFVGRTEFQAPDIDNQVLFNSDAPLNIGQIYKVEIEDVLGMDLFGRLK